MAETAGQIELFDDNAEYQAFVDKFKPKKTTDDCYTPPLVYEAIRDWACAEYGIDPATIVRPFYPGGDYEQYDYQAGCCVLDNPPFSILSRICNFYLDRGIAFFLFAPSLTCLNATGKRLTAIITGEDITYENGAVVKTAFVTNLGGDIALRSAPSLRAAIKNANEKLRAEKKKTLPKYSYPAHVITAAACQYLAAHDTEYEVKRQDCHFIRALDAQREKKKGIFGGGLLLSEKAAAEKAAEKWELSEREWAIVQALSKTED